MSDFTEFYALARRGGDQDYLMSKLEKERAKDERSYRRLMDDLIDIAIDLCDGDLFRRLVRRHKSEQRPHIFTDSRWGNLLRKADTWEVLVHTGKYPWDETQYVPNPDAMACIIGLLDYVKKAPQEQISTSELDCTLFGRTPGAIDDFLWGLQAELWAACPEAYKKGKVDVSASQDGEEDAAETLDIIKRYERLLELKAVSQVAPKRARARE